MVDGVDPSLVIFHGLAAMEPLDGQDFLDIDVDGAVAVLCGCDEGLVTQQPARSNVEVVGEVVARQPQVMRQLQPSSAANVTDVADPAPTGCVDTRFFAGESSGHRD